MDLGNNLQKAFFTDMLANRIPVTKDVSIEKQALKNFFPLNPIESDS